MEIFIIPIVLIAVLITIRAYIRKRIRGDYVEIMQLTSRGYMLPESLRQQLEEAEIRYRTVRKGGLNMPFAPLYGPQYLGLEVHRDDLLEGRKIVSQIHNKTWRGRT